MWSFHKHTHPSEFGLSHSYLFHPPHQHVASSSYLQQKWPKLNCKNIVHFGTNHSISNNDSNSFSFPDSEYDTGSLTDGLGMRLQFKFYRLRCYSIYNLALTTCSLPQCKLTCYTWKWWHLRWMKTGLAVFVSDPASWLTNAASWLANGIVPHVKHWSQSHLGTPWRVSSKECSFPNQRVLPRLVALGECARKKRRRKKTCSPQFAWKPYLEEKKNGSEGPVTYVWLEEAFVNKIFDQWKLCMIASFQSSWLSQTIPKTRAGTYLKKRAWVQRILPKVIYQQR